MNMNSVQLTCSCIILKSENRVEKNWSRSYRLVIILTLSNLVTSWCSYCSIICFTISLPVDIPSPITSTPTIKMEDTKAGLTPSKKEPPTVPVLSLGKTTDSLMLPPVAVGKAVLPTSPTSKGKKASPARSPASIAKSSTKTEKDPSTVSHTYLSNFISVVSKTSGLAWCSLLSCIFFWKYLKQRIWSQTFDLVQILSDFMVN